MLTHGERENLLPLPCLFNRHGNQLQTWTEQYQSFFVAAQNRQLENWDSQYGFLYEDLITRGPYGGHDIGGQYPSLLSLCLRDRSAFDGLMDFLESKKIEIKPRDYFRVDSKNLAPIFGSTPFSAMFPYAPNSNGDYVFKKKFTHQDGSVKKEFQVATRDDFIRISERGDNLGLALDYFVLLLRKGEEIHPEDFFIDSKEYAIENYSRNMESALINNARIVRACFSKQGKQVPHQYNGPMLFGLLAQGDYEQVQSFYKETSGKEITPQFALSIGGVTSTSEKYEQAVAICNEMRKGKLSASTALQMGEIYFCICSDNALTRAYWRLKTLKENEIPFLLPHQIESKNRLEAFIGMMEAFQKEESTFISQPLTQDKATPLKGRKQAL